MCRSRSKAMCTLLEEIGWAIDNLPKEALNAIRPI